MKKGMSAIQGIIVFLLFLSIICFGIGYVKHSLDPNKNNDNKPNDNSNTNTGTLVEDIVFNGYGCLGTMCQISSLNADGTQSNYSIGSEEAKVLADLYDFRDYVKIDIYYTMNGEERIVDSYKLYVKSTNEDISDIKDMNIILPKIGFYPTGTQTDSFEFIEVGSDGIGEKEDGTSYTYTDYKFKNANNIEFSMKNLNEKLNLTAGQTYEVTFEVEKSLLSYEYTIVSVK